MIVEPHGRIAAETLPFQDVERVALVRMKRIPTVYRQLSNYGLHDWFVWLSCSILLFGLALGPWIRRRVTAKE